MNPQTRITRVAPTTESGLFAIPLVPYPTTEGGMDFRGDYCFDSEGLECPLFWMCALVIRDSNVIQANLNVKQIGNLSADNRAKLESRVENPKPDEPHVLPYAISTLRENALCANIPELDPAIVRNPEPKSTEDSDQGGPRYKWQERKDM